ncbi:hypothetical protein GAO09_26045 [Rhizobiales bacterium RZME27]|uniref:Uncharacterized protein n=1 Tax=Endobacterium cereale TaxID=2663029 RepID=A0A6A8ALB1_9HYPH|nr:hypothetical protein [Endobacterium cereale]MEB2843891.1 hypothetical protein [Endobacterium cereale]MQY49501.1 hypothetical protein [Endobacterium cereale]
MTTLKRITILFAAVLVLAHGLMTADSHPPVLPGSVVELEYAVRHEPVAMHAARGGHQCRETGCTIAAGQTPCAVMPMIVPDLPVVRPVRIATCFDIATERGLVAMFFAPPVPPPRSPVFEATGASVA